MSDDKSKINNMMDIQVIHGGKVCLVPPCDVEWCKIFICKMVDEWSKRRRVDEYDDV
ncbi:unnamed protein product [Sphenostylis stenocarpa]|uniref:Uncharacterized protein n=1 Tax=Sphenostylis stenocarpa TaxID=92480 RepID=A0AA86VYJ5_9FABA|nr:unnamed protein product [Sphenostylis stenocarpa]